MWRMVWNASTKVDQIKNHWNTYTAFEVRHYIQYKHEVVFELTRQCMYTYTCLTAFQDLT